MKQRHHKWTGLSHPISILSLLIAGGCILHLTNPDDRQDSAPHADKPGDTSAMHAGFTQAATDPAASADAPEEIVISISSSPAVQVPRIHFKYDETGVLNGVLYLNSTDPAQAEADAETLVAFAFDQEDGPKPGTYSLEGGRVTFKAAEKMEAPTAPTPAQK